MDNNLPAYGNYNPLLNVSITQPLLRGFGMEVNQAPLLDAIDNELLNKLNVKQAVIDQITQVIAAYRSLILSGNNLEHQQRQLKEARRSFDINEKKIAAGQMEPTGNIQQSYQIESISLMVEQAKNDLNTTAQDLLQVIGLDPNMRLSVPSDLVVETVQLPSMKQSIALALTHNTQYIAQKMLLSAHERAYKVAKNQQLWQLDLSAQAQLGTVTDVTGSLQGLQGIYSGKNLNESARLTLKIPINDKSRKNELISAKIRLEKDKINLLAARRALETTVTNTINTIQSQANRYELAKKQVALATQSYELEKKKLLAGISTALDVTNTQNQLIQAQSGLINAKVAYLNQLSSLQRILGSTLDYWKIQLRYGE
jgi:outer membrane protein TolC